MASLQPTLMDPDKLGLLIQCRMKMDKLNDNQLYNYASSTLKLLSIKQLKKLLFVGFNSIKNDVEYNQLFEMKTTINQIIEQAEKLKKKSKPKQKIITNKQSTIPIIAKNASLTKIIPFDIISNNICTFLKMSSITNLAKCDRKLAIICHTPTSIKNLMRRDDIYRYVVNHSTELGRVMIDGHYNINNYIVSNLHRYKNVEKLSIELAILQNNLNLFNLFNKVKHLSFYDAQSIRCRSPSNEMKLMPFLQTISFVNTSELIILLFFLEKYRNKSQNVSNYFNKIIHGIKSISFVDCCFDGLHETAEDEDSIVFEILKNMVNFILQSQPNNLLTLKFENSFLMKTIHPAPACQDANNEFENIERIKTSLSNIKGFVYGQSVYDNNDNLFFNLTKKILSNLISFNKLQSLHTHSLNNELISLYLNYNNRNALNKVSELCISMLVSDMTRPYASGLYVLVPNLEKLCLVIHISDQDKSIIYNFETMVQRILQFQRKLKVLQIVAVIKDDSVISNTDPSFCVNLINILNEFTKTFVDVINNRRNDYHHSTTSEKQQLLFKYHVKLSHYDINTICKTIISDISTWTTFADIIQSMILNYLVTYPFGKIQFKLSWNVDEHNFVCYFLRRIMKGLNELFKIDIKHGGYLKPLPETEHRQPLYCDNNMDFQQYAISATKQNIIDKCIQHEMEWNVDCRYCCNTPWV